MEDFKIDLVGQDGSSQYYNRKLRHTPQTPSGRDSRPRGQPRTTRKAGRIRSGTKAARLSRSTAPNSVAAPTARSAPLITSHRRWCARCRPCTAYGVRISTLILKRIEAHHDRVGVCRGLAYCTDVGERDGLCLVSADILAAIQPECAAR